MIIFIKISLEKVGFFYLVFNYDIFVKREVDIFFGREFFMLDRGDE